MSTHLRLNCWQGLCLTVGWSAALAAAEPVPAPAPLPPPPAVEPQPAPRLEGPQEPPGALAEARPPARHPPRAPQPQLAPVPPDEPGAELDGDLEQGPRHPLAGTVKLVIKRDGVEVSLEAPAAMFDAEELKDLLSSYLPKPDPAGLGVRVYNLRKRGIDIPFEVIEKLARKAAKGADEQQPELNFHFDEPNRLLIVSAWEAVLLDRVDLVVDALGNDVDKNNRLMGPQFFMPAPGMGGPGGPGGPGMGLPPGGPGGPGGRGEAPALGRPLLNNPDGGGAGGAEGEMQRRKQMEQEQLQKRLDKERRKENARPAPEGGKPDKQEAPPPAPNEQF